MLSAAVCHCPDVPAIVSPIAAPVKCACCGEDLTIACPNQCAPEHVDQAMTAARVELRRLTPATADRSPRAHKPYKKAEYRDKVCACGATFTPTGGRDTRCAACKARRAVA